MLKQVFNKEQLSKVISSSDVWRWKLLSRYTNVDAALDEIVKVWEKKGLILSSFNSKKVNNKTVFTPNRVEDAFAIKLLDRFIRRIYKVRQSDRNRIVKQVITLLKDSGDYHIIRLDIKNCYESIELQEVIEKFQSDLILSPSCMALLREINDQLKEKFQFTGLPRGLSISPTLAELYLEKFDKKIASNCDVIYSARYVDDIILFTTGSKKDELESCIEKILCDMNLEVNECKSYSSPSKKSRFDYLGYFIEVESENQKPNEVHVSISNSKINKIKSRIVKALYDNGRSKNIKLLKRRIEFLSLLKKVKKSDNGNILAGIANNYQYSTDNFESLKTIDRFFINQLKNPRFKLMQSEINKLSKISFYGNAIRKNTGKFTRRKISEIMRVWKNA